LLCDAHLLIERRPGRFVYHDLLLAYATELSHRIDGDEQRAETVRRLVEHYLYSLGSASHAFMPFNARKIGEPPPGVAPVDFTGADLPTTLAWIDTEYENILAVSQLLPVHYGRFLWALSSYQQDIRYYLADSMALARRALAEAERGGDPWWPGFIHFILARSYLRLNRNEEARDELEQAIAVGRATGDPVRLAHGLLSLALSHTGLQGVPSPEDAARAYPLAVEAREIYQSMGDDLGRAEVGNTLELIGWHLYYQPGGRDEALALFRQAIEIFRNMSRGHNEASAWLTLGRVLRVDGQGEQAVAAFRQALELYGEHTDMRIEPLVELYLYYGETGQDQAAQASRAEALSLLETARYPDIDRLVRLLDSPAPSAGVR
jgi:tetratricopeptide (TPR) repeat protein